MLAGAEVAVVIPAWNEAGRIGQTVRAVKGLASVHSLLVVDDGSTDATAAEARAAGAEVLTLPHNAGKGEALRAGVSHCRADIILLLDADLEDSAAMAGALIGPVARNEADMTIAQFIDARPAGFGLVRALARWGIRMLTGLAMESPLSGQRAVRREILDQVGLAPGWGSEVALTIDAARLGYRVQEVPVRMHHRQTGRTWGGFVHRGRQFADVARALIHRWLCSSVALL